MTPAADNNSIPVIDITNIPLLMPSKLNNIMVRICVITEKGCDRKAGEFTVYITHLLNGWIGEDDHELIRECVWEDIEVCPEEGGTEFVLEETGEREDVFWHKYYKIRARIKESIQ